MPELAELEATRVENHTFTAPASATGAGRMRTVPHRMSAIEYIVATARPNEVTHVREEDYYNKHLWRSYKELGTRYSCS